MTQFIATVGVLGIVVVGLLVMVQAVSPREVSGAIGRILGFLFLAMVAVCLVKNFCATVVSPWLTGLFPALGWLLLAALAIVVGVGVLAIGGRCSRKRDTENS